MVKKQQKAPTHTCPCGCGAQIAFTSLACRAGWARLPQELKTPILRNYGRDRAAHMDAVVDAVAWYQEHPLGGAR